MKRNSDSDRDTLRLVSVYFLYIYTSAMYENGDHMFFMKKVTVTQSDIVEH